MQLYDIARESVHNAGQHARATHILVSLDLEDGRTILRVRDNGIGNRPDSPGQTRGMGRCIMQYRADQIGARLDIHTPEVGGMLATCKLKQSHDEGNR